LQAEKQFSWFVFRSCDTSKLWFLICCVALISELFCVKRIVSGTEADCFAMAADHSVKRRIWRRISVDVEADCCKHNRIVSNWCGKGANYNKTQVCDCAKQLKRSGMKRNEADWKRNEADSKRIGSGLEAERSGLEAENMRISVENIMPRTGVVVVSGVLF
jgi:hypothetical protein